MYYKCLVCLLLLFAWGGGLQVAAQELNAIVKVNSAMAQGVDRQVVHALEEGLHHFVNGRRWSDNPITREDKIHCTFTLVITERMSSGGYSGELYVQSQRTVSDGASPASGNSGYRTPMVNVRDTDIEFDYAAHQPLQFDPNFLQGNLTAVMAYYAYLIVGLDKDVNSLYGGTSCFRNMASVASGAASYGWKGWGLQDNRSRSAIAVALNDAASEEYRQLWFDYHREEPAAAFGKRFPATEMLLTSIDRIGVIQSKRPTSILLKLFGDAKLDEIIVQLSSADTSERARAYNSLMKIYSGRREMIGRLR